MLHWSSNVWTESNLTTSRDGTIVMYIKSWFLTVLTELYIISLLKCFSSPRYITSSNDPQSWLWNNLEVFHFNGRDGTFFTNDIVSQLHKLQTKSLFPWMENFSYHTKLPEKHKNFPWCMFTSYLQITVDIFRQFLCCIVFVRLLTGLWIRKARDEYLHYVIHSTVL